MPELPSGTLTFLFTDIEGSTKLLHELGVEGYAEALPGHRRVITTNMVYLNVLTYPSGSRK